MQSPPEGAPLNHFYAADTDIAGRKVTVVLVQETSIATDEAARRSLGDLRPMFGSGDLVLCASDIAGMPIFVGPREVVEYLGNKTFDDFQWGTRFVTR